MADADPWRTLDQVSPEMLEAILSKVGSLDEQITLRRVCRRFDDSAKALMLSTKVLDVRRITQGVTESIFPQMRNLLVIPNTPIDATLWQPDGYFATGENLATHCPNIEFFHWAPPKFILSYSEYLERDGKPVNVKMVRASYQDIDSPELVTLLNRYKRINVFAEKIKISEFLAMTPEINRDTIASRIVTIKSHELFPASLSDMRTMSKLTNRLQSLDVILKVENWNMISELFPELEHLRIKDNDPLQTTFLNCILQFIIENIRKYESFGLAIDEAETFNGTQQIVQQLLDSQAKFTHGADELEGTRLRLGSDWSVEVKPFRRRFTTHINVWPAMKVQELYQLFPPAEHKPIRLYAISPLAPHGPFAQDVVNAFLQPLVNIRSLHIKLSSYHVKFISQNCPNLENLRLRIVERDQPVNLDGLNAFFTACVAGFSSFSLSIDEKMSDTDARRIVTRLAELGAKFRYTEEFGYPFLRLGKEWYVTSCNFLCIRRWPTKSIDTFARLFRPMKKLHIKACRATSPDATTWQKVIDAFSTSNNLQKSSFDFSTLHNDEPARTDH